MAAAGQAVGTATAQEFEQELLQGFLFSLISSGIETISSTAKAKAEMNADVSELQRDVDDLLHQTGMQNPEDIERLAGDAYRRIAELEDRIGSTYYAGQQDAVDDALRSLDELGRMIEDAYPDIILVNEGQFAGAAELEIRTVVQNGTRYPDTPKSSIDMSEATLYNDNKNVREWYVSNVREIETSIDQTLPIQERAMLAFNARNELRTIAGDKMQNLKLEGSNMYECTPSKKFSDNTFVAACEKIENNYPNCRKKPLIVDIDGTSIQKYDTHGMIIGVFNDFMVGAVYIESEINLDMLFGKFRMYEQQ